MIDQALHLASLGFAIVPLHEAFPAPELEQKARCSCGRVPCASKPGKHPRTAHGLKDATTDANTIRTWWSTWPQANIAIVTGAASSVAAGGGSLVVLDVDGPEGVAFMAEHALPATLTASTGKGHHYYFAGPAGLKNTQGKLARHLDTRAENGYVIAPPSLHASGRRYEWTNWTAPAALPASIIERLTTVSKSSPAPYEQPTNQGAAALQMAALGSPALATIDTATVSKSLDEWTWAVMNAAPGTKHATLRDAAYAHACAAHESGRPRAETESPIGNTLLSALRSNSGSAVENWDQACATISSAFDRAYARNLASVLLAHELEFNEDGLARRFAKQYGLGGAGCVCHVPGQGWRLWTGKIWAEQPGNGAPTELISHMLIAIHEDLIKRDQAKLAELIKSKKTAGSMGAILRLASRMMAVPFDAFDRDPYLLCAQNGTIDLRTGALLPHKPSDLITRMCAVSFDSGATPSGWIAALGQMQRHDAASLEFCRVLFGSFLFGRSIDGFWIMYGNGFDGKTTVLEVLSGVLGGYAGAANPRSILVSKSATTTHTSLLGSLIGKRLVAIDELPADSQLDTGAIKQHFGRMAEQHQPGMGKDFVSAVPTMKGLVATNHLPRVDEHDLGTRRRVTVIPFDADLAGQGVRKDDSFAGRLVELEGPAILAWLVSGFMAWNAAGQHLPACARVSDATTELFEEGDQLSAFLGTCDTTRGAECTASDLYNAYKVFAQEQGEYVMSKRAFGNRMRERRITPHKGGKGIRMYVGVKPPATLAPPRH